MFDSSLSTLTMKTLIFLYVIVFFAESSSIFAQDVVVDTAIFMREARLLQEIIVNPEKEKYSEKDNPAVELMRRIRKNEKKGDPRKLGFYNYDQYDKTTLGLLDISEEDIKKNDFLNEYIDTTSIGNRPMVTVLLNEKASTTLHFNGGQRKIVERGKSAKGISEMFDVGTVDVMLDEILREVDIYENDITILGNKFPSPLSSAGTSHYKYFITDTLDVDGMRCIQLTFSPKLTTEFSFSGNLYVELGDSTGFIKKVSMKVPRTVNINFIDNLFINQIFEKDSLGKRHKLSDQLGADICLVKGTQRLYANRSSKYENFSYEKRDDLSRAYNMLGSIIDIESVTDTQNSFLSDMRGNSLSNAEGNMGSFMSDLRKIPVFYWGEKVLVILVNGYIKTGRNSKFDFGPVNTLISANPVEKIRLRIGGMTTANLSPHLFCNGYVAYGIRDKKWKYKAELEYSFNKKRYHKNEFPRNAISATCMYDIDMVGQHYLFTNPDNVFLSLKRKRDMLVTYRQLFRLEYNLELNNRLSFCFFGEHRKQEASPWLTFINGYDIQFSHYRRTSFGFSLRFAPGERLIQSADSRQSVNKDAPVIEISQEWGPRCLPGADYAISKTELSLKKRFWFSSYGYLDAVVKGGILWTKVPFVELLWPHANLSYTIQPESYSLMNPMEYALDRFASCDLTYWGNGVLFNRIPLVKLARLREVVSFKCLWGSLSDKNNPACDPELFRFPKDANVGLLRNTPYMEISAGIDNILKILRVDYVWRLSYLKSPGIDKSGLRVALHFTF